MSKNNSGPHVNLTDPHVEEKARIDCLVSREVKRMWEEIVAKDKEMSEKRYYPAHTLERMIRADYQIMKAFGTRGREKNGKTKTNQRKTKNS
ncbi:hypothetical protein KGA00_002550 [Enterococcus faecalis]|nr:hypothetical protein [Enterococcus faecalis]EIB6796250.1 hypothetical protein [Enterococcus faecalis]